MPGEAGPSSRPNDAAAPGPSPSTVSAPPLWTIEDLTQREGPDPEKPFGGLNVDGSLAGEAGWAAPPEDYYSSTSASGSQQPQQPKMNGLRSIIPRSSRKEEPAFVACAPRQGPATFGQDVVNPAFVASLDAPGPSSGSQREQPSNDIIPLGLMDPSSPNETATLFTEKVNTNSGVTLADIVEGRTCRPIALIDLRTWLVTHRETTAVASPPSLVRLELPDLNQDEATGSQSSRSRASLSSEAAREKSSSYGLRSGRAADDEEAAEPATQANKDAQARAAQAIFGELDALNFVVAYDRYTRRFRTLTLAQKAQAPRPCDIVDRSSQLAPGRLERRDSNILKTGATSPGLARGDMLRRPSSILSDMPSGEPSAPKQQPFRERFNRLLDTYVGPVASSPTSPIWRAISNDPKANSVAESTTVTSSHSRRLDWMTELGLVDESLVSQALADAIHTTNPEVLLPLVDAVSRYLDAHVIPDFMSHASKNLSSTTSHGRLSVGITCTAIALLFSVLLCIDPSPLTKTSIPRWYRILTFPFWTAGFGYMIAAKTGVCVWLSLRGNREPGDDGSVSGSGSIYNGRAGGFDATGGASTRTSMDATWDLNDERVGEEGNLNAVDNSDWLMAPEIRKRLGVVLPVFRETQTPILPVSMPQAAGPTTVLSAVSPTDRTAPAIATSGLSGGNVSPTTAFRNPLSPVAESNDPATTTLAGAPAAKLTAEPVRHDPNAAPWTMAGSNNTTSPRLKSKIISLPRIEMGMRTVAPSVTSTPGSANNLPSSPTSPTSPGYFFGSVLPSPGFVRRLSSATPTSPMTPPAAMTNATTLGSRRASMPTVRGSLSVQIPEASSMMSNLAPAMTKTTTGGSTAKTDPSATVKLVDDDVAPPKDLEAAIPRKAPQSSSTRRRAPPKSSPTPPSLRTVLWTSIQRWTGFAVATEKVRDERIRKIHLKAAFKALTLDGVLSLVATIIVVAIP